MALLAGEIAILHGLAGAVVAVGDDGMVAFASEEALRILGRDASFIGQPLASIVPVRLRARHHAGFSRYVTSGQSNLQGGTVRVPALRGDGTETDVDLTIRVFRRPDGTKMVAAALSVAATGKAPAGLKRLEAELTRRLYALV